MAPSSGLEKVIETVANRLPSFVVSHSSTIKLWMNGAQRTLGHFMAGPPALSAM